MTIDCFLSILSCVHYYAEASNPVTCNNFILLYFIALVLVVMYKNVEYKVVFFCTECTEKIEPLANYKCVLKNSRSFEGKVYVMLAFF